MNLPDKIMKREKKNSNSSIKYELDSIIMRFQTCFHSIHSTSSIVISTIVTSFFFYIFHCFSMFFFSSFPSIQIVTRNLSEQKKNNKEVKFLIPTMLFLNNKQQQKNKIERKQLPLCFLFLIQ